jgi:3-hydroxyacyl-CoA dehydrogenase
LGQKTGSGIYRYGPGDTTPHRSGVAEQVIAAVQQEQGRTPRRPGRQDLVRRLAFRMVAEAFRVVEEGVAASDSDVDTATVLGVGFPGSRGGVIRYARDLGLGTVLAELEDLAAQYGPRYKPCDFLRS